MSPEVTWWHHRTPFKSWGCWETSSQLEKETNRRTSISNNLKTVVSLKKKKNLLLHCPHYKAEIDLINLSKTKVVVEQSVYFLFLCFCFLTSENSLYFPFKHEFPCTLQQKRTKWKVLNFSSSLTFLFSLSLLTDFYWPWPDVFLCPFLFLLFLGWGGAVLPSISSLIFKTVTKWLKLVIKCSNLHWMPAVVTCRIGGPTEFQAPVQSFYCVLCPTLKIPHTFQAPNDFWSFPVPADDFSIYSVAGGPPWGLYNPQPLQPIIIKLGQFFLYNMSWSSPFPIPPLPPHNPAILV